MRYRVRGKAPSRLTVRRVRCWSEALLSTVAFVVFYFVVPVTPRDLSTGSPVVRACLLLAALALVTLVLTVQVRRSLRPDRLPAEQLALLLGVVNVVVVFFALVYYGGSAGFSGLETRLDALYFTVTTLCTVGYGDITPIRPAARAVVTLQMVFDLIIVTSALSLIVTAQSRSRGRG